MKFATSMLSLLNLVKIGWKHIITNSQLVVSKHVKRVQSPLSFLLVVLLQE